MINATSIFGLLGSITASSLFFPQVWTSYKSKRTHDLAWPGIIIGLLNGLIWIIYGYLKLDYFLLTTNILLFLGAFLLFLLKRKYG